MGTDYLCGRYGKPGFLNDGKMAEGVCGGIAKYFDIDVSIVRFVWLLLCLAGGVGIWLYLIFAIAMPQEPKHK